MSELLAKRCTACVAGAPPLRGDELARLHQALGHDWTIRDERRLEREYRCRDFADALAFTNRIGALAEAEGHHPEIHLRWGRVGLVIWTQKIQGLTESDFILAAKIGEIAPQVAPRAESRRAPSQATAADAGARS